MDPSLIVALASLAASTYFRNEQAQDIKKEQRGRVNAETMRQRRINEEREAAIDSALPRFGRQEQEAQQADIAQKLSNYITPTERPASEGEYVGSPGEPVEIKERGARVLHDALVKGKDYAKNLARVSSYGRLGFDNSRGMNRLGENVGRLNTTSARSEAILPLELQAALSAGDDKAALADIAGAIGTIAGMYYAGGGGAASTVSSAPAGGAAGGTGVTATASSPYYSSQFAGNPALRQGGGLGLRYNNVPRLTY